MERPISRCPFLEVSVSQHVSFHAHICPRPGTLCGPQGRCRHRRAHRSPDEEINQEGHRLACAVLSRG